MASKQIGQIVALTPGGTHASVSLTKAAMCSHGSCSHRILPDVGKELQVDAVNPVGALVGDVVEISFEARAALGAAFTVYILPIVVGLSSYLLAASLLMPYPALWALVVAGAIMAFGLYKGNNLQTQCTILRRLDPKSFRQSDQQGCAGCPLR